MLDTDIVSEYLRDHPHVVSRARAYLQVYQRLTFSIITCYEVLGGLLHRHSGNQLADFLKLVARSTVLPFDRREAAAAAKLYRDTRAAGHPIDDIDLLIAGTAQAHDLVLVTNNTRHFASLGVPVENWKR